LTLQNYNYFLIYAREKTIFGSILSKKGSIFALKNFCISKKSSNFAADFEYGVKDYGISS